MQDYGSTRVVQVTNIAPQATRDQMYTLFSNVGKVEDIKLYPSLRDASVNIQSRVCFVRFADNSSIPIVLHTTNTVFIDRAIIVQPFTNGDIPDELSGLEYANASGVVRGESRLPPHVSNEKNDDGEILTVDISMSQTGLPPFPPLTGTFDHKVVEEIRRTVVIMGVGSTSTTQDVIDFFTNGSGEVKYFRWCSNKSELVSNDTKTALVEFSDYGAVIPAMRLNNTMLGDHIVQVYYSSQTITKPQTKSNEAAQKEIEEAMKKVKEAQNLVTAAVDPLMGMLGVKPTRSRSRTPSRSRDYDRHSGRRRSRSRSRDRYRRRSKERRQSRDRKKRSRSRKRSRTRSKDRKKEEKKKDIKEEKLPTDDGKESAPNDSVEVTNGKGVEDVKKEKKSRSKSKDRRRSRSGSHTRKRSKRSRSRGDRRRKSRSRERRRSKDRRRSRSRDHKSSKSKKERRGSKDRHERKDKEPITRDYDQEEAGYERSSNKTSKEANSGEVDMEISNSP